MASRLAHALGVLGVALLLAWPSTASAAPAARLVYSRTADAQSCPDEDALRRAVAARVGYDAFFPWAKRAIIATISHTDGAFVADVDLIDEQGIRHGGHQLRTAGACTELLDTVALAVAIAIDPQLLLASSPPPKTTEVAKPPEEPAPAVSTDAAATTVPREAVPTFVEETTAPNEPPPSTRARRLGFEVSAGATGALGVTPGASLGGTLGGAVRLGRYSLGLEGFVADSWSRSAKGGGSIESWPALVTLAPCAHFGPIFGCALVQSGAVFSSTEGIAGGRSSSSAWWALGGRVGAEVHVQGPWLVRLRLDLLGDLSPAKLEANGQLQWSAPDVAGALGVDAVFRFP